MARKVFDMGRAVRDRLFPQPPLGVGLDRCALLGITREGRRLPDIEYTDPDGIKVLLKDVTIRSTTKANLVELTCRVSYELRKLPGEVEVFIPLKEDKGEGTT